MTPITLCSLRKMFGSTAAVDGIDMDIAAGDLFFLLGPSGCGKTTLLRMIAGFTDPTEGSIKFGDRDVTHLPPNKRNCGMVFQGYALWPHMTVRQNVAFGLKVRKAAAADRDRRTDAALDGVQMLHLADRKPNQLSGGQQQRVALARALVIQPTVLLLDEPLSNLDAKLRLEMRSEIKRICKGAGTTAVYVTHDQKEALSMADRVAVLHSGKAVQVGAPGELYHRPINRFVANFLGETNFLTAEVIGRDDDGLLLDCPAGRVRSSVFPDGIRDGVNVTCSIRPEAVRVIHNDGDPQRGQQPGPDTADSLSDDGSTNHFDATRHDLIYLGEIAQHHLIVGGGIRLTAFELNPRPQLGAAAGVGGAGNGRLRISFAPQDVIVLTD